MARPPFPDGADGRAAEMAQRAADADGAGEVRRAPLGDTHSSRLYVGQALRVYSVTTMAGGVLAVNERVQSRGQISIATGGPSPVSVRVTDLYESAFGQRHPSAAEKERRLARGRRRAKRRREAKEWADYVERHKARLLDVIVAEVWDGFYTQAELARLALVDEPRMSRLLSGDDTGSAKMMLRLAGARDLLIRSLTEPPPSAAMAAGDFKALRIEAGYTQEELAERWRVNVRTLRRWETEPGWLERSPAHADALRFLARFPKDRDDARMR